MRARAKRRSGVRHNAAVGPMHANRGACTTRTAHTDRRHATLALVLVLWWCRCCWCCSSTLVVLLVVLGLPAAHASRSAAQDRHNHRLMADTTQQACQECEQGKGDAHHAYQRQAAMQAMSGSWERLPPSHSQPTHAHAPCLSVPVSGSWERLPPSHRQPTHAHAPCLSVPCDMLCSCVDLASRANPGACVPHALCSCVDLACGARGGRPEQDGHSCQRLRAWHVCHVSGACVSCEWGMCVM